MKGLASHVEFNDRRFHDSLGLEAARATDTPLLKLVRNNISYIEVPRLRLWRARPPPSQTISKTHAHRGSTSPALARAAASLPHHLQEYYKHRGSSAEPQTSASEITAPLAAATSGTTSARTSSAASASAGAAGSAAAAEECAAAGASAEASIFSSSEELSEDADAAWGNGFVF